MQFAQVSYVAVVVDGIVITAERIVYLGMANNFVPGRKRSLDRRSHC